MNVEVQTRTIRTNQTGSFVFHNTVKHFIVGFSEVNLEYPETDHHVSKIKIDITGASKSGRSVTITPKLTIKDKSNHKQSQDSSITIAILATTGHGNSALYMKKGIECQRQYPFAWSNVPIIDSSLVYTQICFHEDKSKKVDHHIKHYESSAKQVSNYPVYPLIRLFCIQFS